jgi:hypothetical protein
VAVPDVWDRGGTYTREEMEHFRGPLNADAVAVAPNGKHPAPTPSDDVRSCGECGKPLGPGRRLWCDERCRRRNRGRAATLKAQTAATATAAPATLAQEVTEPTGMDTDPSGRPGFFCADLFDQLAALPSILPTGWRLEATASTVVVTWQV